MLKQASPEDVVQTTNVAIKVVDFTDDPQDAEPAYDVNIYVDGEPVTGGSGVFSIKKDSKAAALSKAKAHVKKLIAGLVKASGGTLRGAHVNVVREILAIAREVAKINQKDYKFWVVVDGKIESGWEYSEDAKEQLGNLPSGKPGKVYQRAGLKKLGLDPDDDSAWTGGKKASPNRQADTGDAAMYFNISDFVQKRDGGIMMPEQWQPSPAVSE